jgi:hypothetical protein
MSGHDQVETPFSIIATLAIVVTTLTALCAMLVG